MALKVVPICVYANHTHSQLALSYIVQNNKRSNHRVHLAKWERFGVTSRFNIEDGMCPNLSDLASSLTDKIIDESQITRFKGFHKDLDSLPLYNTLKIVCSHDA